MRSADNHFVNHRTILEYRSRINAAMKFIVEHSASVLHTKTIASVANFSPFHFHRVFVAFTGESPGEYIRKLRMKKAVNLIWQGVKISEIGDEVGYLTPSSFTKAFRKTYGVSPSQFKKYIAYEPNRFDTMPASRGNDTWLIIRPKVVNLPSVKVFYIRKQFSKDGVISEKIGKAFDEGFIQWDNLLKSFHKTSFLYRRVGFIRNFASLRPEKIICDAGIIFQEPVDFDNYKQQIGTLEIQEGKFAVFLHKGPYNTLWQTWSWIYNHWLGLSGYKLRDADPFEVYLNDKKQTLPGNLLTEIHIPIY